MCRHHEGRTLRQQLEAYQLKPSELEPILQKVFLFSVEELQFRKRGWFRLTLKDK
jgi:hypothetical protein